MSATKGLTLKYEERLVDLEEFLRLDIPADVKKRVWDENKVSDAIYQRKRPVDTVKILQMGIVGYSERTEVKRALSRPSKLWSTL